MKKQLKDIIRFSFDLLGFEIHRKRKEMPKNLIKEAHLTRTKMSEALEHLKAVGFSPATVIDVGVADGTYSLYRTYPDALHLLVEPLKEFEPDLKEICNRYNAKYVLAAAGASPGMMEIGISPALVTASFFKEKGGSRNNFFREVPVVTLDDVCLELYTKGPYLVKVDVQGYELHVLDGAKEVLNDAEVVILEVSFFPFQNGIPVFHEVIDYMKNRGFVTYDLFDGHNRALDGARAQIDIAFVKENGRFRSSHGWGTPEQVAEFDRLHPTSKLQITE